MDVDFFPGGGGSVGLGRRRRKRWLFSSLFVGIGARAARQWAKGNHMKERAA